MAKWNVDLKEVAKKIKDGEFAVGRPVKEVICIYEHYETEMIMGEEDLTCRQADIAWKNLHILRDYVYSLSPEYKEKRENENRAREERMQRDIEAGKIQVVHFQLTENGIKIS